MTEQVLLENKTSSFENTSLRNDIFPFSEYPPNETSLKMDEEKSQLAASDLFGYFTADIIKEGVLFTR